MTVLSAGACVGYDPAYWDTNTRDGHTSRLGYVRIGGQIVPRKQQIEFAMSICSTCPVITECLLAGLDEEEGIWGRTLPDERKRASRPLCTSST